MTARRPVRGALIQRMAFSLRTKLTIWYVTLLAVTLISFSLIFSYTLSNIFMRRVDSQISSIADMMAHMVIKPSGQLFLPGDFEVILERFFGIRTGGNYIQVLTPDKEIAARSTNLEGINLPISQEVFSSALSGKATFEVMRNIGRYPLRVITKPITLKEIGTVAIVQVGVSLEGTEEIFHSMLYLFSIGIVASVILASGIGYFLAHKALAPVAEITAMAKSIGAENLHERIRVKTPGDEIGELASTINAMIARLEMSFDQIKQFTADASHELKTPLTVLKGEMEVALRSDSDAGRLREAIESGLEEIDRMAVIVRNLLDLANMDAERAMAPKGQEGAVDLHAVLSERVGSFERQALDKGISLSIIKAWPLKVKGDPVRLGQMISNLIDNAIKYTEAGGAIALGLEGNGHYAILTVRDTGIGISGEDLPRVFDRFYRADKARSRSGMGGVVSAGLGLSICREIVEGHGGTIEVWSEFGKGSQFTVRIPLAKG